MTNANSDNLLASAAIDRRDVVAIKGVWRSSRLNPNLPSESGAFLFDAVPIARSQAAKVVVTRCSELRPQAVGLAVQLGAGRVCIRNECASKLIWWVHEGMEFHVSIESDEGQVVVTHAWKRSETPAQASIVEITDFAGMQVEVEGARRVYHCNNGLRDEAFDSLVFELELL